MNKYYTVNSNECWEWKMAKDKEGYGRISFRNKGSKTTHLKAHRWMYENLIGKIPEKMVIDHLCQNTSCVNPSHMEPVTIRENTIRGIAAKKRASTLESEPKTSELDHSALCPSCGKEIVLSAKQ